MKQLLILCIAILLFATIGCNKSENDYLLSNPQTPAVQGVVIRVPQDVFNIQKAIDSAVSGDTILVAPGIYTGEGNRDIYFAGEDIVLLSEDGPAATIINCQSSPGDQHFAFHIFLRENSLIIDGFTFTNAYYGSGAAIYCTSSDITIQNCVFTKNYSTTSGIVRFKGSDATMRNCTFYDNSALVGGAISLIGGSQPDIDNCLIAFNTGGGSIYINENTSIPSITCTNIFGNVGSDWFDDIAPHADSGGNMNLAPLFCDTAAGVLFLNPASPNLPENNSCGIQIGALGACP